MLSENAMCRRYSIYTLTEKVQGSYLHVHLHCLIVTLDGPDFGLFGPRQAKNTVEYAKDAQILIILGMRKV